MSLRRMWRFAHGNHAPRCGRAGFISFLSVRSSVAQPPPETARSPFADRAPTFHVHNNAATINFPTIASFVRLLHIGFALVFYEGIAAGLAGQILHNAQRFNRPVLLKFAPQLVLRGIVR